MSYTTAYTKGELKYLRDNYQIMTRKEMADGLTHEFKNYRTRYSVIAKLKRLGLSRERLRKSRGGACSSRGDAYSNEEVAFIKEHCQFYGPEELTMRLNEQCGMDRTRASVATKKCKLGANIKKTCAQIVLARNRIAVTDERPIATGPAEPAVISTLQLAHAMSHARHSVKSLSAVDNIGISSGQILDMLIRTGVSKQYAPRIRTALGMT